MAEHPARLLELAIGLEPRRFYPGLLRALRTVDELRGCRRDARIVEHRLELGDYVGRGIGGSAGRVVVQEAELGEFRRNHLTGERAGKCRKIVEPKRTRL